MIAEYVVPATDDDALELVLRELGGTVIDVSHRDPLHTTQASQEVTAAA